MKTLTFNQMNLVAGGLAVSNVIQIVVEAIHLFRKISEDSGSGITGSSANIVISPGGTSVTVNCASGAELKATATGATCSAIRK